jgi:ubiquinone biosynthesis protein UbiJ
LYDLIIEKHSERYREEETKLFLSEIDQLKSHLSELTERIDEISA